MVTWRKRLADWLLGGEKAELSVTARVDDSPGWGNLSARPHDYTVDRVQEIYSDALEAWRKNPIAWRIISITTDYVIGDNIIISGKKQRLDKFIKAFWFHPKNQMNLRLQSLCDELSRAGDLFVVLFRNPADGMSYLRLVTKDRIYKIETASNDWENELVYHERLENGETRKWLSYSHPEAENTNEIMLHYAVNRPVGALLGESDLTSMLVWLKRYSRMLEDRVRLHWAIRAFLWIVTVPTDKVASKREQYSTPPDGGSIIVKDSSEEWEAVSPTLHAADSQHDFRAVRGMIDAGSGYPPHWRGEAADANLATAQAMQGPTERHLTRRQDYFVFMLMDILLHAYKRASMVGKQQPIKYENYQELFGVNLPDVSRQDNEALAKAAKAIAEAFGTLAGQFPKKSAKLSRIMLRLLFNFAGQPQDESIISEIMSEGFGPSGEGENGGEDGSN